MFVIVSATLCCHAFSGSCCVPGMSQRQDQPSSWVASAAAEECAAWPFGRPDRTPRASTVLIWGGGGVVIGNLETSVHYSFNRAVWNKHITIIAVRLIIIKPLQFHLKLDSLGRSQLSSSHICESANRSAKFKHSPEAGRSLGARSSKSGGWVIPG